MLWYFEFLSYLCRSIANNPDAFAMNENYLELYGATRDAIQVLEHERQQHIDRVREIDSCLIPLKAVFGIMAKLEEQSAQLRETRSENATLRSQLAQERKRVHELEVQLKDFFVRSGVQVHIGTLNGTATGSATQSLWAEQQGQIPEKQ